MTLKELLECTCIKCASSSQGRFFYLVLRHWNYSIQESVLIQSILLARVHRMLHFPSILNTIEKVTTPYFKVLGVTWPRIDPRLTTLTAGLSGPVKRIRVSSTNINLQTNLHKAVTSWWSCIILGLIRLCTQSCMWKAFRVIYSHVYYDFGDKFTMARMNWFWAVQKEYLIKQQRMKSDEYASIYMWTCERVEELQPENVSCWKMIFFFPDRVQQIFHLKKWCPALRWEETRFSKGKPTNHSEVAEGLCHLQLEPSMS